MPPSKGSLSNIEIAQQAKMKPIVPLAKERLGIPEEHLSPFGHFKAKISLDYCTHLENKKNGKLILVTAISPTPAGEGKTTMTVGLGDALNRIGKKAIICLREPALGPVFGMKGGAAGGGYAQVVPMEDINLHFTGDFSAIALANNLLAAMIDNHIHHGNACGFDVRRITWRRVVDCNDRALRDITVGLGGPGNGLSAPGWLRHRRRLGSHGDFLPLDQPEGPQGAPRQDRGRLHARPQADPRARHQGAWRDGGAAEGRARAEPGADAREQPGLHPRRPVREHRARLQFGHGDQDGAQARRLRRHRRRLRRRPRAPRSSWTSSAARRDSSRTRR